MIDLSIFNRNILGIPMHYIKDGEPCRHVGCKAHLSHPCEVCGRISAKGEVNISYFEYERKLKQYNKVGKLNDRILPAKRK